MSRIGRRVLLLLGIVALILSTANVSFAEKQTTAKVIKNAISLGEVTLRENVVASVNDLMISPSSAGKTIGLTLSITNNSSTELNFIDYWLSIYTKSGSKLTTQTDSGSKMIVPAKSTKEFLFYATASSKTQVTDLIVKVTKWDFSAPNYTRILGEISVPQRYNPVTATTNGKMVTVGDAKSSIVIEQATLGKSEKYYRPTIDLTIENKDTSTITLPDYQLFLQTDDNLLYPITVSNLKGTTIDPLSDKTFNLTASIPIAAKVDHLQLVIMYPVNEGKTKVPVAQFELPKSNATIGDDLNKYYTFTNSEGVYNIKLNSLNRLPIEDNDLVVANLTIANKGTESIPVPTLSGTYLFNGSIKKSVTVTNNSKVIAIPPGGTVDLQFSGTIPYTFDISKANLIIQQKDSDSSEVTDLVEFSHSGSFNPVPSASLESGYEIKDIGYRSKVNVGKYMVFDGETAKIVATQITVTNQEKRLAEMQQLAGYFEKEDGTVYAATFQTITDKLTPGGNALLYAWTTLPQAVDTSGMKLVIGKAIVEKPSNSESSIVTGYVSPNAFKLPDESTFQDKLQGITLEPYQLSIKRVKTSFIASQSGDVTLNLEFDYNLKQDLLTKSNTKDQKLLIELMDANQESSYSKELALNASANGTDPDDAASLKLGDNTIKISWPNSDFATKVTTLKDYSFNVYLEFQPGYKKLIATQKLPWLVNRSL